MSLRRVWAMTRKEIRLIQRDRATAVMVLLAPAMLLFMLAYAMTSDINHVPVAALDLDRTTTSRALLARLTIGEDLDLIAQPEEMGSVERLLLRDEIDAAVVIPAGFERTLRSMRGLPLQILVDGTEPQTGGFAVDHISRRVEAFVLDVLADRFVAEGIPPDSLTTVEVKVRNWYNPNLKARVDLIPGLLSMVLGLPGMSVALTLAREREHGTLEQLLATPISRMELLLGKIGPYLLSGLANVVLTTAIAITWFRVPFRGDFLLYLGLSGVFFFSLLSMAMIVGVFSHTQAAAMALSFLVVFFPGFFLTGIFFPLVSMPPIVRLEALSLPGSHYAVITRGVFITGVGLGVLWPYGLALLGLGCAFIGIAALFFRKKLA